MEQNKKEKGLPIFAILALIVLVAGICAAMIPSLKNYQESVRMRALMAESKAIYYTVQDVVRQAEADGSLDAKQTYTKDGSDSVSQTISRELMGLVKADYQFTADENGQIESLSVQDGKYTVSLDADGSLKLVS